MKREQFLKELKLSLKQFPDEEIKDIINYYDEMITDKVEQGATEEAVIESLGNIKVISARIQSDLIDLRMKEPKNIVKTSNTFFLVLMLCASPALIPLGIAFFAVFFSIFITCFALVISFGVTSVSLLIALIPVTVVIWSSVGAGGALLSAGIIIVLIGIFALLTVGLFYAGSNLLNMTVRTTNKMINKYNKRGKEND